MANGKDKGLDFTKGSTEYTFNDEQLKSQRDTINEINLQIAAMNAGSDEYNKSLVKQNENFAAILAEKRKIAGTDALGGEDFQDLVKAVDDLKGGNQDINAILSKRAAAQAAGKDDVADLYDMELQRLRVQELSNQALSGADELTGGMASKAMGMYKTFVKLGPTIGLIAIGVMAAVGALVQFEKTQEEIASQFGAIGVTELRSDLAGATAEFKKFGMTGADAQSTISNLSNEFGTSVQESAKLSTNVRDISIVTATSLEDTSKLVGLFTQTQGLTGEQAENLLISTTALANANNVAPDKVLADVANNTEAFAKFAQDGGENILRAAVQARKLGLDLDKVANVSNNLLDFQSSLNNEITASVMIGRDLNLQKARELALSNDIEGAMAEVVKQVGSEAEFNKLNALERQALADAVGLQVGDLQKLVNKEKESVTLAGELAKQDIGDLIPEETITQTAQLIGQLTSLGVTLAEVLGPPLSALIVPLNMVMSAFGFLVGVIDEYIGIGPALLALLVATKFEMIKTAAATMMAVVPTIMKAVSTFFSAASLGSLASFGFGTPALVAMAVLAAGALYKSMSSAKRAGDMMSPAGGKTMVSTKEGGLFEMSPNDDIMAAPGLAAAMGGGGGGGVSVDTSGIEKGNTEVKNEMTELRKEMANYFGFGGTVANTIGSKVGDKLVTSLS